jgi:hypothetical protein
MPSDGNQWVLTLGGGGLVVQAALPDGRFLDLLSGFQDLR